MTDSTTDVPPNAKRCRGCGRLMHRQAERCPHCGKDDVYGTQKGGVVVILVLLLVATFVMLGLMVLLA